MLFVLPLIKYATTMLQRQKAYCNAYNELNSLSDRELADIGVTRCEIPKLVMDTLNSRVPL
jgi:uncharacterized protein YjiS (DUF1127 family)